jgi:ionotropic glutamate receptor
MTVTPLRRLAINFTSPILSTGLSAAFIPKTEEVEFFNFFTSTFSTKLLFSVLGLYVAFAVFLALLAKLDNHLSRRENANPFTIMDSLWNLWSNLNNQGSLKIPDFMGGRVLIMAWWVFCVVIVATYTANMAASLSSKIGKQNIPTIEALFEEEHREFVVEKGSAAESFLNRSKKFRNVTKKMKSLDPEKMLTESARFFSEGKAAIDQNIWLESLVRKNCKLSVVVLKDHLTYSVAAFGMSENHSMYANISLHIIRYGQNGLMNKWWDKYSGCPVDPVDPYDEMRLGLGKVKGLFILMGISIVAAFVAFAASLIKFRELWSRLFNKDVSYEKTRGTVYIQ